jgi:hypothetical protein
MFRHIFVVFMCSSKLCLCTLMTNILVRCDLCEAAAYLLYMLASLSQLHFELCGGVVVYGETGC